MSAEQSKLLDTLLTRLQGGDATLKNLVSEELSGEEQLQDLLVLASRTQTALSPPNPDPQYVQNAELRLFNHLRARRKKAAAAKVRRLIPRITRVPALVSLILVIAIVAGTVGVGSASAAALPGDGLYTVKLGLEEIRLFLTIRAEEDLQLLSDFSDERLREVELLSDADRADDLDDALKGYVSSIDRLSDAAETIASLELSEKIQEKLLRHVDVLETVQAQVPIQAQGAIQGAIDRSLEHALKKEQKQQERIERQENNTERQEERLEQQEQEKNQRQAEQIARQYGVTAEQVLEVFDELCAGEWKCVRDLYKEERRNPSP
jgi:hypothetical protein